MQVFENSRQAAADLPLSLEQWPNTSLLFHLDPLDDDGSGDVPILLTNRQLLRLMFVAAHTGSRFQREESDTDPMAWCCTARRLFNGKAAIQACAELTAFRRAIIFHGLELGVDAPASYIDRLLEEMAPNSAASEASSLSDRPIAVFSS